MPEISNRENPYAAPTVDPIIPVEDPPEDLELATRSERFLGSLIDTILFSGINFGLVQLYDVFDLYYWNEYVYFCLQIFIFLGINAWLLSRRGQSIGKAVMRTKVVLLDGGKPSLGRLIGLRYIPFWLTELIPHVGSWIHLINVLFVFREDKRCMHDLLAGTKVVKIGRFVPEMPQPRLMPRRNPAHAAHALSKLLLDELDLLASEIHPGTRWVEDLDISPEDFAAFCRKLEAKFNTLTSYELEKCATYGDLLQLLGIPLVKRPR